MVIIDVQNTNKGDKDNEDDKWTSLEKINYDNNWNNNGRTRKGMDDINGNSLNNKRDDEKPWNLKIIWTTMKIMGMMMKTMKM